MLLLALSALISTMPVEDRAPPITFDELQEVVDTFKETNDEIRIRSERVFRGKQRH